ncbi:MAG: TonB-dependent receptor [Acidobacteriota bacterium]|jgi:iron complex outermembrane receptor protein
MLVTHCIRTLLLRFVLMLLLVLSGASILPGQTKQLLIWQNNLDYLQNATDSDLEEQKIMVERIRTGVEFWLQLHPRSEVQLPDAPPQPWSINQVKGEIATLLETVETLLKQESFRPFELGVTEITVTSELSPLSPVADSMDNSNIHSRHATDAVEALQYLPGIALDFKPSRNQSGILIRGFDTRQVGLYWDGIPIYVPYDGYADIGRFLTSNVAEIQVAKGYSSPLLGPNGLGGAVNIVTRQPEKKFEGNVVMGTGSGEMLESGIHIGSRMNRFLFQGGMDWLQTDYYPLSGDIDIDVVPDQPSYGRSNSYERDADYDGRIGFVPNERDRYTFSFMGQKAEYGTPPYSGIDPDNNSPKYWRWDYWDRESYYFNSTKSLGGKSEIRFRIFYDRYPNRLDVFSDNSYSTLESYSTYNDHSAGLSSEFSTRLQNRHTLSASFFFKDDTHKEADAEFVDGEETAIPSRTHRDQQVSFGVQDSINLTSRIQATLGFSGEKIIGVKAQDLRSSRGEYSIIPFECAGEAGAESFSACIDEWAFNPLASISFSANKSGTFFFTFAKKSHFPTMKDRYSYKNNKAIPNPELEPEHSRNWSIGYWHVFPFKTMVQVELFRSDVYDAIERAVIPEPSEDLCPRADIDGTCEKSVNVGKELHQGVELLVRSNPHSRISFDVQYSYLSRSISGPENMPAVFPTGTPKHKTVGSANILLPRDISLLAAARYENGNIGDFLVDEENFLRVIPASNFATADLGGIIPVFGGTKLRIGVKNIFDRNYYYREGYPMAGRNWYCNMKYNF